MARRRMFSLDIVDSDAFLEMPPSSQNLYFHIGMRSDDDGFCASPNKIMKIIGASSDDLRILIAKRFLLECQNGVVVVKHWWLHNTKRKDTYQESHYLKDNPDIRIDENKAYTFNENGVRYRSVNGPLTQDKISKDKISKDKISNIEMNEMNENITTQACEELSIPSYWDSSSELVALDLHVKQLAGVELTNKELAYLEAYRKAKHDKKV